METRKACYEVYIGLRAFVEYATNNRSSILIFIWALETRSPCRADCPGSRETVGILTLGEVRSRA